MQAKFKTFLAAKMGAPALNHRGKLAKFPAFSTLQRWAVFLAHDQPSMFHKFVK